MRFERTFQPLKIHIETNDERLALRVLCQDALDKMSVRWYEFGPQSMSESKQKQFNFIQHLLKGLE